MGESVCKYVYLTNGPKCIQNHTKNSVIANQQKTQHFN